MTRRPPRDATGLYEYLTPALAFRRDMDDTKERTRASGTDGSDSGVATKKGSKSSGGCFSNWMWPTRKERLKPPSPGSPMLRRKAGSTKLRRRDLQVAAQRMTAPVSLQRETISSTRSCGKQGHGGGGGGFSFLVMSLRYLFRYCSID